MVTITESDVEQVALEWRPNIVLFLDFGPELADARELYVTTKAPRPRYE